MTPSVLIIVLHYRGIGDTEECLRSLSQQTCPGMRTLLIDNGSGENIAERVDRFDGLETLVLPENLGWSGGNNAGISLALDRGIDFVCLLNNDTVLPPHAMQVLMETAARVGPCVLHPAIESYTEGEPVQLDPSIPEPPYVRAGAVPAWNRLYEITLVNGACVFVHTTIFRTVGLIDDRFFLMWEDVDFGVRARAAGYRIFCDCDVRIRHKESRAFGGRRSPIKTYYTLRNSLLYFEKHPHLRGSLPTLIRSVAWLIWGSAQVRDPLSPNAESPALTSPQLTSRSWWALLSWLLSSHPCAKANRMALRDYVLRRFGRINRHDERVLTVRP
jgi:GT2 family glycosyltransferase